MGVNIYTGKGFKNPEERGEFGSFVQELIARYAESDIQYYVIGEIDVLSAKLDLLLITQKSLIIADFKKLTAATKDIASKVHLRGKQNGPWEYVLSNGKTCTMGGSGKKDNAYQQLESFRHEFAEWLVNNSQSILGKPVKKADFMNMLGAWAVIDPGFDENLKDLALPWDEIHDRRSWFKIIPLEKLAWEFNCCSTMADGLSIGAIEGIIKLLGANAINLDEILPLPPTAPDPFFSQPHIYGNLVDRHDECTKLSSLIKDEKVSVISIRGLGGVGKTELAAWLTCTAIENNFQVRWIDCSEKEVTSESFLAAIASEIPNRQEAGFILDKKRNNLSDRMETALNYLARSPIIVIFNDFHRVTEQNGMNLLLTHIVHHYRQIKAILVTREYPECLDNPTWRPGAAKDVPIHGLPFEAVMEFINLDVPEKPPSAWEKVIYERTSGNPYALKLITSIVRKYGWREQVMQLPLFDAVQSPESQKWFASLVDTLSEDAKNLAQRLSVVRTNLSQELINFLWHEPNQGNRLTLELTNSFILEPSDPPNTYRMHEFIREYLQAHTPANRHDKYHVDAGKYFARMSEQAQDDNLKAENLCEALFHFKEGHDPKAVEEYASTCYNLLTTKGDWARAQTIAVYALEAARQRADTPEVISWLVQLAQRVIDHDHTKEAGKYLQEAANILPKPATKTPPQQQNVFQNLRAQVYIQKGRLAYAISDLKTADECFTEALNEARKLSDRRLEASCLLRIGRIEKQRGAYEAASQHFEEAEEIARSVPDTSLVIESISHQGLIYKKNNEISKAQECFTLAYENAQKIGDKRAAEINYSLLGGLYMGEGHYDEAAPIFRKCLELCRELGSGVGVRINLGLLAEALIFLGEYEEAEEVLSEVEQRCRQVQDEIGMAWTLKRKGQLLKTRGKIEQGDQLILEGIQKLHEVGNQDYVADFERALGSTQLGLFNSPG